MSNNKSGPRTEQQVIEQVCDILRLVGDADVTCVCRGDGQQGPGWYAWNWEYPEGGAFFLSADREVVATAQCIVEHERKMLVHV